MAEDTPDALDEALVPEEVLVTTEESTEVEETVNKGRKRTRNPENWNAKHVKKRGLRKNSELDNSI